MLSLKLKVHWSSLPYYRACKKANSIIGWMEQTNFGAPEKLEQNIERFARKFHPDYSMDGSNFLGAESPAAALFKDMERGDFDIGLVRACAPEMLGMIPKKSRGVPAEYYFCTLLVSASLAVDQIWRLMQEMDDNRQTDLSIAKHLYWFERFYSLWRLTAANKPPNLNIVNNQRRRAKSKYDALEAYLRAYSHPDHPIRTAVANYFRLPENHARDGDVVRVGDDHPSFRRAYDWALKQNIRLGEQSP